MVCHNFTCYYKYLLKCANYNLQNQWFHFILTETFSVGLSCHDIQANQGATKSGVYLIHPPNLAQGPWKVYCDLQTEGGGWMVFQVRYKNEPKISLFEMLNLINFKF